MLRRLVSTSLALRKMSEEAFTQHSGNTFDIKLQKEVSLAKQTQENKFKKRKVSPDNKIKDKHGFKVRVSNDKNHKHKQEEPEYDVEIVNNLRRIKPYYFTYKTFCKLRWRDRNILNVFTTEFRDRDREYYKNEIMKGTVFLDDEPANLESIIRNGQIVRHTMHRHEPPVNAKPIKIIYEDDKMLVIDKPGGIPVHPTGRYRFNSITKILERDFHITAHPCNRLDKQTSGLMFLGKNSKGADEMGDQLKAREVSKEYVARVVGEFPVDEVVIEKPLKSLDPRVALNVVCSEDDEDGKHAKTIFKRVSYDGQTSIVVCKPLTGRQHQIRVHLQYLGYPIANDPIYSNPYIWGDKLGKNGDADFEDVTTKLYEIGRTQSAASWYFPDSKGEIMQDEKCPECGTDLYTDPNPNDLFIWLHAYKYESTVIDETTHKKKWSYRTEFPDWALEPHLKYMEMAIEEAKKCGPTTTAFSVGAVLVFNDKVLSTGYSRELPGNTHAEQCALEKYFDRTGESKVPKGTVIFTTMEPCSFRLSGNDPCVQRILSQDGNIGSVFVGVMEPDTFVKNNTSLTLLEDSNINYILIPGFEEQSTKIAFKGHEEDMK